MEALKALLFALADDEIIMGHRASEWTGLGPILEADLALSSMAQDEMGHALLYYGLLEALGEAEPDTLVFRRDAPSFRNAIFCELPRGDWGHTIARHFLYDLAEQVRLESLSASTYTPLAEVATKIRPEEKYHLLHGTTWIRRLAHGTDTSRTRVQHALDELLPYAAALWETIPGEELLARDGVLESSGLLKERWYEAIQNSLSSVFTLPSLATLSAVEGGRLGRHSQHFQPLLDAMQMLNREMPDARW